MFLPVQYVKLPRLAQHAKLIDIYLLMNNRKKNVAILYNTTNHVVKSRLNLIKRLQADGYTVFVFAPADSTLPKLKRTKIIFENVEIDQYGLNPFKQISWMINLAKLYRDHKIEASLNFTIKPNTLGNIVAAFCKVRIVNNIAGMGEYWSANYLQKFISRALYRVGMRCADIVFFQNADDRQYFVENNMCNEDKAQLIPGSGVDLRRHRFSIMPSGGKRFVFVGRLLVSKGADTFISAARACKASHPEAEFHIAGCIEDSSRYIRSELLRDAVEDETCIYHGELDRLDVIELLKKSHVIVLPTSYGEGVPRVLLEAAAIGRPCVTTMGVGARDVVEDGKNGWVTRESDTVDLSRIFSYICDMKVEELRPFGEAARLKVEQYFDEEIVLNSYSAVLERLI